MHHFKHPVFKPKRFKLTSLLVLFFILNSLKLTHSKIINELSNFTNMNENFKYDSPQPFQATPDLITKFELLKSNPNADKNQYCSCPPKGQFSDSNLKELPCKHAVNEEAKYACKSGYIKSSGNEILKCVMNKDKAEWDGKPLNCKILNCLDPGDVTNADKIVSDPSFSFNTQVSYQCHNGYISDSKPFLLCDRNGQWNRKKPVCKLIQCPLMTDLDPNLFHQYIDYDRKVNSTVNFQCKQGYHLDDEANSNRTCEWTGNWTNSNPICIPNYCEIPENLINEIFLVQTKTRYNPGEKVTYKCKGIKKYTTVECQLDGNFKPALPVECPKPKKTHCPSVEIQHGQVNSSAQDEFIIGAKLSFKCDENYVLSDSKEIHCLHNGEWTSTPPRCQDYATIRTSQILSYILTCIIIILVLIVAITVVLLFRWRQKQLQKRQWQRYFCNLEYQACDKTKVQNHSNHLNNLSNPSQEMHIFQAQKITVPFTDL